MSSIINIRVEITSYCHAGSDNITTDITHSLVYMPSRKSKKKTSHHIHIFIIQKLYLTHFVNFFSVLKLRSFFIRLISSEGTYSNTCSRTFSKFFTSFSRTPVHSPCSTHTNNAIEILMISRSSLVKRNSSMF